MTREEGIGRIQTKLNDLPCGITREQAEKLYDWYIYLTDKNKEFNLTAITDFDEVLEKHFRDSLLYTPEEGCGRVIDIGTGAGFPGMPLAILHPDIHFTLMDSLNKRIAFIQESVEMLGLANVTAVHARAEDLAKEADHRGQYERLRSQSK